MNLTVRLLSFTLLLVFILCTRGRAQENEPLDGAQVRRATRATVPKGRATLVFSGLTKDMDPGSIQIKSDKDDFMVLSVSHRLNFNEPPAENPEAEKIYDAMADLDRKKARLTVNYRITEEEDAILKLNRVVASPQTGLDAEDLIAAVNFHRQRISYIKRRQLGIRDSLAEISTEKQLLQEQLAELGLQRQGKATAEIVVVTQSERAVTDEFTLSYLVPNARWIPHYDVRVADISKPVDLRYRAKVSQQTGEDWTNVKLTLSTGNPRAQATAPTLSVWRLSQNSQPPGYVPVARRQIATGVRQLTGQVFEETGEPLIGATILVPGTAIGTVTDFDGRYSFEVPAGTTELVVSYTGYSSKTFPANSTRVVLQENAQMLDEVVVTGYASANDQLQGRAAGMRMKKNRRRQETAAAPPPVQVSRQATTVSFDIELPYTIASDNKARDVEIRRIDLPATYTHLSVPKFSTDVYLTAAVTDWADYDLLSGAVNLFFEGTYLGTSALDVATISDTLKLGLGRDPGVVIRRKATEDYRARNFFGSKVTDSRGYTISVRNNKRQAINLVVMDQVPVSADEEIEVKIDHERTFRLNEETGILTWKTRLSPDEQREQRFGYTVKYPKGQRVRLE